MKVKVVFYSMYGHIYRMAESVAGGAREVQGAEVQMLQVPELVPDDVLERSGAKQARSLFGHIPTAKPKDLADTDAVIFGTPTRFGNMCAQMRNFLDQTGLLWAQNALVGKVGSVFYIHRSTARRAGNYHHELSYHSITSRDDYCRGSLFGKETDGDG